MLGWLKPKLRNSLFGRLGGSELPSGSDLQERTEDAREAMLASLGPEASARFPELSRRIRYAGDIQTLWYVRGELMGALAAMHGETAARAQLAAITASFRGLLPEAMSSRPSPLEG